MNAKLHCGSTDMDKQSYALSQIFIKSYLVRQAPASFNVYLPEREGSTQQPGDSSCPQH